MRTRMGAVEINDEARCRGDLLRGSGDVEGKDSCPPSNSLFLRDLFAHSAFMMARTMWSSRSPIDKRNSPKHAPKTAPDDGVHALNQSASPGVK